MAVAEAAVSETAAIGVVIELVDAAADVAIATNSVA